MDLDFLPQSITTRIEIIRCQDTIIKEDEEEEYQLPGARIYIAPVEYILQNGPQCGLVALQMAAAALRQEDIPTSAILEFGQNMGVTRNGEIFSTEYMAELAQVAYPGLISASVDFPSPAELTEYLLDGKMVLIPYDCDKNHEPAFLNGHKAHWALIIGFVVTSYEVDGIQGAVTPLSKQDLGRPLHILARHGKTRFMAFWKYEDLLRSNAQLEEPGPLRPSGEYIFPSVGMQLKKRCVVVSQK